MCTHAPQGEGNGSAASGTHSPAEDGKGPVQMAQAGEPPPVCRPGAHSVRADPLVWGPGCPRVMAMVGVFHKKTIRHKKWAVYGEVHHGVAPSSRREEKSRTQEVAGTETVFSGRFSDVGWDRVE